VGWTGITEFFNPARTYFNTSLATPRASADPDGLTFFHRTRFKLYRTTNGAASWIGVYETTDGGTSWHLFGQGLPVVNVSDLYMPPDASYLRVSTHGRGVWEARF
jgi:hypothetical protein